MATILKIMTAEELECLPDDGFRYELVRGELIQMSPAGQEHGTVAFLFGFYLANYLVPRNLGRCYSADTGYKLAKSPDTVLAPDFSFIHIDRLPLITHPQAYIEIPPDLVLEVLSPTDRIVKLKQKAKAWLDFGGRVVITINPRNYETSLYRSETNVQVLSREDTLELPDIALGWSLPLRKLFE
jgi:Uma2 family endonuclease